jgi:hypothetical protein
MTVAAVPSPLLSVEESAREARRLRCWDEADQTALVEAAQDAVDRWSGAWGLGAEGEGEPLVRCQPASDRAGAVEDWAALDGLPGAWWAMLSRGVEAGSGLRRRRAVTDALHQALFRETASERVEGSRLADELVQSAWTDWQRRLAERLGGEGHGPREPLGAPTDAKDSAAVGLLFRPWSGALQLVLPWCGQELGVLLDVQRVAAFLKRPEGRPTAGQAVARNAVPLVPIYDVVKSKPVALRVELAEMEIDLGTLAGLRVGDVLRTTHGLDMPLRLVTPAPGGGPSCAGYLGRQGDRRAIELAHFGDHPTGTDTP